MITTARLLVSTILGLAAAGQIPDVSDHGAGERDLEVVSSAPSGAGSLAEAVARAASDPAVHRIVIRPGLEAIRIAESLTYSGAHPLRIVGNGAVIDASICSCDALVSDAGADLDLDGLTIRDAHGRGILLRVPAGATGEVVARLEDVTVTGSGLHGVHVDDQRSEQGRGFDSPATIRLELRGVRIERNGFRPDVADYDGLRVDEGGPGDVRAVIVDAFIRGNAGDGVELDERGSGDVVVQAESSHFDRNGAQPQKADDPEDGLDVDELGDGSVRARFIDVTALDNRDAGIDLDEAGDGDLVVALTRTEASGGAGDGFSFAESGSGELRESGAHR